MRDDDTSPGLAPVVELRAIEKSFPGVLALRSARLELRPGEVHALMGENGAGKSTLMKILTGVYQPDFGEILVDGKHVKVTGPRDAQALGISIIHQELHLMNHLTAAQNIFISREPRRGFGLLVDEAQMNADAAALFARMNVDINANMLSLLKSGKNNLPLDRVPSMAKALEVDPAYLLRLALDQAVGATAAKALTDIFGTPTTENERGWLTELRDASDNSDPRVTTRSRAALRAIFGK